MYKQEQNIINTYINKSNKEFIVTRKPIDAILGEQLV